MGLYFPAFWHFSCNSNSNGRVRLPISLAAVLAGLVVVTFFVILHFSRNQALEDPIRIVHRTHTQVITDPSLYHYGVVVDAGSSGSRLFIYTWPTHGGDPGQLLRIRHMRDSSGQVLVKKIEPGLSSLKNSPEEAGRYLRPLLDHARDHVPVQKMAETPIYVLATAGMRLLGDSTQKIILESVRSEIRANYTFLFNANQVEVITGKQEGIFAWIAVNFVLGKFNHQDYLHWKSGETDVVKEDTGHHERKPTLGIIDMGGGSAQIAYEVGPSENVDTSLLAEFNLGCRNTDDEHQYRLYVTTFLQYGTNSARARYHQLMTSRVNVTLAVAASVNRSTPSPVPVDPSSWPIVSDPCLPRGLSQTVLNNNTHYTMLGAGDYDTCRRALTPLLNLSAHCAHPPCTINGQHLAPINFTRTQFIGFSEYFYSTEGLLNNDGLYDYGKFYGASKMYCSTLWSVIQRRYRSDLFKKASADRRRSQCFKSAWITSVLHVGFRFPVQYDKFKPIRLVEGQEVQWTLGALLYKTRYFPLREVQRQEFGRYKPPWKHMIVHRLYATQYFFIACIVLVILSILLYLRRLRRIMTPQAPAQYHSLPSQTVPVVEEEVVIIQGEVFKS